MPNARRRLTGSQTSPFRAIWSLGAVLVHPGPPLQRRRKITEANKTTPRGNAKRLRSTPASSPPATPKETTTTSTPKAREERTERLCPVSASCCVLAARNPSVPSTRIMPSEKTAPNIHGLTVRRAEWPRAGLPSRSPCRRERRAKVDWLETDGEASDAYVVSASTAARG
jgi:hypothetical protein